MSKSAAHDWRVLLIGGPSGVGKSTAARQIGQRLGVPWLQADDFRMALQRVCAASDDPALHYFVSAPGVAKPGIWHRSPQELVEALIGVGRVVSRALEVVMDHHVAGADPVVVEGDAILPSLAARSVGAEEDRRLVRAVFVVEPDEQVVHRAMRPRGSPTEQRAQAEMYIQYGGWLRREAETCGLPVLLPRPYATLADRILSAVAPESVGGGQEP